MTCLCLLLVFFVLSRARVCLHCQALIGVLLGTLLGNKVLDLAFGLIKLECFLGAHA